MKVILFLAAFGLASGLSQFVGADPLTPTLTCDGKNAQVSQKITNVVSNPYCCAPIINRQSCLEERIAVLKDIRDFIKPYYNDINLTPCGSAGSGPAIDSEPNLPAGAPIADLVSMVDRLVGYINQ